MTSENMTNPFVVKLIKHFLKTNDPKVFTLRQPKTGVDMVAVTDYATGLREAVHLMPGVSLETHIYDYACDYTVSRELPISPGFDILDKNGKVIPPRHWGVWTAPLTPHEMSKPVRDSLDLIAKQIMTFPSHRCLLPGAELHTTEGVLKLDSSYYDNICSAMSPSMIKPKFVWANKPSETKVDADINQRLVNSTAMAAELKTYADGHKEAKDMITRLGNSLRIHAEQTEAQSELEVNTKLKAKTKPKRNRTDGVKRRQIAHKKKKREQKRQHAEVMEARRDRGPTAPEEMKRLNDAMENARLIQAHYTREIAPLVNNTPHKI